MQGRLVPLLFLGLACGSATPPAAPFGSLAPASTAHVAAPASPPPRATPLVLSGEHAFVAASWLPSGQLLARTQRELWLVAPEQPERARLLRFEKPIHSFAVNTHDDLAAVGTDDGLVSLVRDHHVVRTFPGEAEWGISEVQLSPDGKLLVRSAPRGPGDAAQVQVLAIDTGKVLATMSSTGNVTFDPTSRFVSNHETIVDLNGATKWTLSAADQSRFFLSDWAGPRLAYPGQRVLLLVDPSAAKPKNVDIACKDPDTSYTELWHAGRYLRACGNRFMLVDGATGILQRIKLPTAAAAYIDRISPHENGYLVHSDDQTVFVDGATNKASPADPTAWRRADEQDFPMRSGAHWADVRYGDLVVRKVDSDALVAGWGGFVDGASDRPMMPAYGLVHRVRGGALEVTRRSTPMVQQAEPLLHRFGTALEMPAAPSPPAECQTSGYVPGQTPFGTVDLRPVTGRTDAACVCLDGACEVRPLASSMQVLSASQDDVLYLKPRSSNDSVLVRVGKDGSTTEGTIDGYCFGAALAADRRVFAACFPMPLHGKPSVRRAQGLGMELVELAAADLAVTGRRELSPELAGQIVEAVGDEISLTTPSHTAVTHLFAQGKPGCTTCGAPTATVSTWPTFSVLERGSSVQVAGNPNDANRAIVCVDGDVVRRWSACRQK